MIFKKLYLENIASLKGQHIIDFDKDLFNETLFAITGATGSGKSTLLSSISTALYGEHYKGAIRPIELVTLGASHGKIELWFFYNGQEYLAKWEVKLLKSDNTAYKDPKPIKTFYKISQGLTERVDFKSLEDLIGLNFNQFCKTVILNQGEFNRFISSSFTERKEILEKLIDDQKIQLISDQLKKDINSLENNIENISFEIKGHHFFTEEELNEKENNKNRLEADIISHNQELTDWEELASLVVDLNTYFKNLQDIQNKEFETTEFLKLKVSQQNNSKIAQEEEYKKIKNFKEKQSESEEQYRKAKDKLTQKTFLEKKQKETDTNILSKQRQIKEITDEEKSIQLKINSLNENKKSIVERTDFKEIEASKIKTLEERFQLHQQYSVQFTNVNNEINFYEAENQAKIKNLTETRESKTHLETQVNNLKNQKRFTIDELKAKESQLNTLIPSAKLTLEQCLKLEQTLKAQLQEIAEKTNSLNSNSNRVIKKREELETINAKIQAFELAKSINQCQEHSLKNQTCIICGNSFHQLPQNKYLEQAISDDVQNAVNKKLEIEKESNEIESFKQVCQIQIENLNQNIHKIKEDKSNLLKAFQLVHESELKNKINQFQNELEMLQKEIEAEQTRNANLIVLTQKCDHTQSLIQKLEDEINQISSLLKQKQEDSKNLRNHLNDLTKEFITFGLKDNLNIKEILGSNIELHNTLEQMAIFQGQLTKTNQLKINNQQELSNLQATLLETNKEISLLQTQIMDLIGTSNPDELLENLKKQERDYNLKEKQLNEIAKNFELEIRDLETKIRLLKETKTELEAKLKRLIVSINHKHQILCAANTHQDILSLKIIFDSLISKLKVTIPLSDYSFPALNQLIESQIPPELNKTKTTLEGKKEILNTIKTELKIHLEKSEKIKSLQKQQDLINHDLLAKKQLSTIIGKDEFRNYVLGLVEKQLIYFANKELKSLCNERYELIQTSKRNNIPEFYIIDKFNGHQQRNIQTLSGGETFLLSLSMALALAEMTRGKVDIQSFFIDEGFGTLDPESIEEVLNVLLNMKNKGKQIGIISHIKHLTDRIPANIRIIKNNYGHSKIDFIYN